MLIAVVMGLCFVAYLPVCRTPLLCVVAFIVYLHRGTILLISVWYVHTLCM